MSRAQTNIDFSVISAINRRLLDPKTRRYFFIKEPAHVAVEGAPKQEASIKMHPSDESMGTRKYNVHERFIIEKSDLELIENGELARLMDCLNFRKKGKKLVFESLDYDDFRGKGKRIIHWVPAEHSVKAEVMMPDAKIIRGLAESGTEKLSEGDIIQFTRFGFCMLDDRKKMLFRFGHE